MSRQQTLWDTDSTTSSPASASGASPCASPDGPTTAKSGPARARANFSARQAKEAGLLMSGTSGLHSTGSSASVALQSSLANRLAAQTASLGSTLYSLTWIKRVTPAGRSIPALRASARPISGSGYIGWATPQQRDHKGRPGAAALEKGSFAASLPTDAFLVGWATCTERDYRSESATEKFNAKRWAHTRGKPLSAEATLAGWATPMAANADKESPRPNSPKPQLPWQASMTGWPTPNAGPQNDTDSRWQERREEVKAKATNGNGFGMTTGMAASLCGPAQLTDSGTTPNGSTAATTSIGQLNPVHSLWLQLGPFATAWARCAERVTLSTSRKPKGSSAR